MGRLPKPPMRLVLMSKGGFRIPLSDPNRPCDDGVFLGGVPDAMWMADRQHAYSQGAGQVGASWQGQVRREKQFELDIIIRGARTPYWVDAVETMCADGEQQFTLVSLHPTIGWRWLPLRLVGVSEPVFVGGHPGLGLGARFRLIVSADAPVWRRFRNEFTYGAKDIRGGVIRFPIDGHEPVWPEFEVTGGFKSVKIRLDEGSLWQELPADKQGWLVNTDPRNRLVQTLGGKTDFVGFVPHWPNPVKGVSVGPTVREGTVFVEATGATDDFMLKLRFTPERSRAW